MKIYRYKLGYRAEFKVFGGVIYADGLARIDAISKLLKQIYELNQKN